MRLRKACTVVVAPNIEHIEAEGGLDDLLTSILTQAEASNIPIVFALSRKKLGQVSSRLVAAGTCPASQPCAPPSGVVLASMASADAGRAVNRRWLSGCFCC